LGNCKGPCEALQSEEDYNQGLLQLRNFLKGNLNPIIQHYKAEMNLYSEQLLFEKAEQLRKKIQHLETYSSRSVVVSRHLNNLDVFSILKDEDIAYVNYLMIQNGAIVQTHTIQLETHLEESREEVLAFAIAQLRTLFNSSSSEIIIPFEIEYPEEGIVITVPKAGDKKKLIDLSEKNVNYFKEELRKKKILDLEGKTDLEKRKVLYQLKEDLKLSELPVHIECFDNSNFQGSFPVSAMVCFKEGIASKDDYRRFNVKTVKGINDFATMKEVVSRRYKRLKEEQKPLPQLIIIDGGKGQLSAAVESLKEINLDGKITAIGLAKNEEEIFFPGDKESIKLPYNAESLKLIRRIRDEVHRFGITFHRNQRSRGTFKNELESIKGIGKNSADSLLKEFKSVSRIKETDIKALASVVGNAKANIVWSYFNTNEKKEPEVD
jgi:excinuclease ABC subunit C